MKHPWRAVRAAGRVKKFGEVAERSIAADCKSAGLVPTEVRTLPSPPLSPTDAGAKGVASGEESGGEGREPSAIYLAARRASRAAARRLVKRARSIGNAK